jgi:soluble lytic murein transglycosylase-like protein
MAQKQWSSLANGQTLVNGEVPVFADAPSLRALRDNVVNRYGPLFAQESARTGVPWPWLAGIAYAESGGNPNALSKILNSKTGQLEEGAFGLMQIMPFNFPKYFGKAATRAEMFDPAVSVFTSANMLAEMRAHGLDLPMIASNYNAGPSIDSKTGIWGAKTCANHACADTSWGPDANRALYAKDDYISKVVKAANAAAASAPASLNTASAGRLGGRTLFAAGAAALLGVGGYLMYRKASRK